MWQADAANTTSLKSALGLQHRRKVYIRLIGKPSNKRHVTEGRIEKRKIKLHTYEVSYTSPLSGKEERKWVSVNDITSLTLEREKQKQKYAKLTKKKKKLTIKKSITCL